MNPIQRSMCLGALAASVSLAACASPSGPAKPQGQKPSAEEPPMVGMANPASEYCVNVKKGRLEPRRDAQGNEYALCHLPDGTVVEEWELFRRENAQRR